MAINYQFDSKNKNNLQTSVQKPLISIPRISFGIKNSKLMPLSNDTFQASIPFKGINPDRVKELAKQSYSFRAMLNYDYGKLNSLYKELESVSDNYTMGFYNLPVADLRALIASRIEELTPAEKIKNAVHISKNKIGDAFVINKLDNKPKQIIFTKKDDDYEVFTDDIKIGQINLIPKRGSVYASDMESYKNDTYKGVGTKLHQLAVETSLANGFGGEVTLHAYEPGAKLFHYKSGFRVQDDNSFSAQMEDVIAGKQLVSDIPSSIRTMYLPKEQIQKIIDTQIKPSPILATTKLAFKGGREQKLLELLKNSEQLQVIKYSDYKDLRWLSESLSKQTEENSQKIYGISLQDVKYLVNARLQELLPSERVKNAKLLQSNIIGTTKVIDRTTNTPIDVNITRVGDVYDAFAGDKNIGETRLTYSGDSIFVSDMLSAENKTYKGLGTKLHQLAVEKSFKDGFGGNVTLHASEPGAKLFHYKSGFRKRGEDSDEFSQLMEDVISGKKPLSSVDKKAIFMFLPEQEIKKIIKTQIKKSPIILDKNFKFVLDCNPQKIKESQELAHPKVLSGKDLRDMMKTSEKLQSIREGNSEYLKNILESLSTENDTAMINKFGVNINDLHYLINCRLNEIALKNK